MAQIQKATHKEVRHSLHPLNPGRGYIEYRKPHLSGFWRLTVCPQVLIGVKQFCCRSQECGRTRTNDVAPPFAATRMTGGTKLLQAAVLVKFDDQMYQLSAFDARISSTSTREYCLRKPIFLR